MSRGLKTYLAFFAAFIVFASIDASWARPLKIFSFCWLAVLTIYWFLKLIHRLMRKFLWRIRRKLILSYIFMGFIPIFLLITLFALAFWIFIGQATSEMFNSSLDAYLLQTKI